MKKIILLVILITVSQISKGQLAPVQPYKNTGYSWDEIKKFMFDTTSARSIAFKNCVLDELKSGLKDTLQVLEENLGWASQNKFMFCEERTLKTGEYQNSGWNTTTGKIEFFPGKDLICFVWICRIGTHEIILCKTNCMNVLDVTEQKIVQQQTQVVQQVVQVIDTVVVYVTDTIVTQTQPTTVQGQQVVGGNGRRSFVAGSGAVNLNNSNQQQIVGGCRRGPRWFGAGSGAVNLNNTSPYGYGYYGPKITIAVNN